MSRKQWSKESRAAALQDMGDRMGVWEAAKLYNLPFETLWRRVVEKVDLECRSGPPTVLTEHKENELASYCVKWLIWGLDCPELMSWWSPLKLLRPVEGSTPLQMVLLAVPGLMVFRSRHPSLTLRSTQLLSRAWAYCANCEIISDFFGKLAAICAILNLLRKPMKIFNMDETGASIVHKGREVVPLFLIYRRQRIMENLKEGAIARLHFTAVILGGWMQIYLLCGFSFLYINTSFEACSLDSRWTCFTHINRSNWVC